MQQILPCDLNFNIQKQNSHSEMLKIEYPASNPNILYPPVMISRLLILILAGLLVFLHPLTTNAQLPNLGTAERFVLFTSAGAVENTGISVFNGDIGTHVGAITGFGPPTVVNGSIEQANGITAQVALDLENAYNQLASLTCGAVIDVTLGNGQILTPGIYCTGAASTLIGNLIIDGEGDNSAIFIIQIDGAFASADLSTITLINGASICNVYWQINGAVELGALSVFRGNIIAAGAISLYSGAALSGRALTTAGAISLASNVVSLCDEGFTIICPPNLSVTCNDNVPVPDFSNLTVLGHCGPEPIFTVDPDVILNFVCEGNYIISRVYRAVNECGDVATCEQIITLLDAISPVLTCFPDVTVSCESDVPAANPAGILTTDNCGLTAIVTVLDDTFSNIICNDQFTISRVYTATDACGNAGTCVQTITVFDDGLPIINCPANLQLTCVAEVPVLDISSVVVTDACDPAVTVTLAPDVISNITCESGFTINRLFTATDACGNEASCIQTIIVNDEVVPVIIFCPSAITVACDADLPANDIELLVATDNCTASGDLLVFSTDVFNGGTGCGSSPAITSRIYTVQDACGNEATCVQSITMIDNEAPVITSCPAEVNIACEADLIAGDIQLIVASDNCTETENLLISFEEISNGGSGCGLDPLIIQRTYMVSDACGNISTCEQILNIIDDEAPVIGNCPADLLLTCIDDVPPAEELIASMDCSEVVVSWAETNNGGTACLSDPLIISRTYTATDDCGNASTCLQIITVINESVPVIENCPSDIQIDCLDNLPAVSFVTATGICGIATVSMLESNNNGTGCGNNPLIITRTFTATDICGNASSCEQTITIVDDISPLIQNCPADQQLDCIEDVSVADPGLIQATDNCSAVNVSFAESNNGGNACVSDPLIITRIYIVSDACGNTTSCDQIFTIIDDVAPVITVLHPTLGVLTDGETISIQCESNTAGWNVDALLEGMAVVTDNCSQDAIIEFNTTSNVSNECEADGYLLQLTYQWIASDNCGNTSSFSVVIQVVDTIAPVLTGVPDDITVSCNAIPATTSALPCGTIAQAWSDHIIVLDECECAEVTFEEILIEGNCNTANLILRIWTGIDNCGNTVRDTQRVSVINDSAPDFFWNTDITGNIANGEILEVECFQGGLPAWVYDLDFRSMLAFDACQFNSDLRVSFSYEFLGFGDCIADGYVQAYEFVWTATSSCGVEGTFKFQIHLTDTTAPVIENWKEFDCAGPFVENKWIIAESCTGVTFDLTENNVPSICLPGQVDVLRTLIVTDGCNNSSVYQQIVASADAGPVFEWRSDSLNNVLSGDTIQLECSLVSGNISGINKHDLLVSSVCSNILNVDFREELMYEGDCDENEFLKTVRLTWTATDECLQTSVFVLMVNLVDNTAPVIHAPSHITVICGQAIPAPFVTDCSELSVRMEEVSRTASECPDYITILRNIIASDECGNSTMVVQEITMTNTGMDMFAGIAAVICVTGMPVPALPLITDPCSGEILVPEVTIEGIHSDCGLPGTMRRRIRLTNDCGIVSEMDQTILIRSQLTPELVIAHPIYGIIENNAQFDLECGDHEINFNLRQALLINACPGDEIRFEMNEVVSADCKKDGFISRMEYRWTADDVCGNETVFSIFVNFTDTQAPVFTNIPLNLEIICGVAPDINAPEVSDLCSEVVVTFSEARVEQDGEVFMIRTWIAEDECGNTSEVSQDITMRSNSEFDCNIELPDSILCNGDSIRITTNITGPYTYIWEVEGGACIITGGQGTSTITINIGFSDVTVRLIVIDDNGCLIECEQTFSCASDQSFSGLKNGTGNLQVTALFPNPADDEINLGYTSVVETTGRIRVFDLLGNTHFMTNVDIHKGLNQLQIALDQLSLPGFYFIELESENVMKTYRFIKN